ncbi:hypothetical protein GW17_00057226 [Ensete ventricosum]|nr:hypothetical protein GW17_00057226 [Ensete ventricosum]
MEKEAKEAAHVTEEATWGTKLMRPPAAPWAHPENERAALWSPRGDDERPPYVLEREPVSRGPGGSPMESILDFFNSWAKKAEDLGHNIWHNREHPLSLSLFLSDRCSVRLMHAVDIYYMVRPQHRKSCPHPELLNPDYDLAGCDPSDQDCHLESSYTGHRSISGTPCRTLQRPLIELAAWLVESPLRRTSEMLQ